MEFVYRRNPGILYDVIQILIMKLNHTARWNKEITSKEAQKFYMTYVLSLFDDPAPELFLFFYRMDDGADSYMEYVFRRMLQAHPDDLSQEDFVNGFSLCERVRQEVSEFYFGPGLAQMALPEIAEEIKRNPQLDFTMKQRVLQFYINPEGCVEKLTAVLDLYYRQIENEYVMRSNEILRRMNEVSVSKVAGLLGLEERIGLLRMRQAKPWVVLSFTLFVKTALWADVDDHVFLIVGEEYMQGIEEKPEPALEVEKLGQALGDTTRVKCMELLVKEGEMTAQDLMRKLGVSAKKMQYHLDVLRQARLLNEQSRGRTIAYWVNQETCRRFAEMLDGWIRGDALRYR